MLDNKYLIPILIGVLIIIFIVICTYLYKNKNTNEKSNIKKININNIATINDMDGINEDEEMTKAEQVGFVNFGDTEDMEFVSNIN